jgi:phenylalanyl-tRNA synthetase beta chain
VVHDELLEKVELFDVYEGNQVPAGKKSAAFSLTLRSESRTLTDSEADAAVKSALSLLEMRLGATLRA